MSVQLLAIKFNHDSTSAMSDALNIRKNATDTVNVPEWQRGVSVNPEDSPAAYSITDTRGHILTIQAKLRRTDPAIHAAYVRAVDADIDPPGPGGCLGILLKMLRPLLRALFGSVLGEVRAKRVTFDGTGETVFETFKLKRVRLWSVGVGVRDTTWRWQYRLRRRGRWTDMESSRHRIYSVIAIPTAAWQQMPYGPANTQLPWTEVMDRSCRWAWLATTLDDAAGRVTREVYSLGPSLLIYDCPGGGSHHYAFPPWNPNSFDCTAFLERLRGGTGNGQYVNCTDCATIVSTFANILGCDLWQSRMGYGFALNDLLGIGSAVWMTACPGWTSFSYHEVAWKGACTSNDEVFDGCLQVDGDIDPTTSPHTALLPVNLRFGDPGDGVYRDRLATAAGRPNCNPQPGTRNRKALV